PAGGCRHGHFLQFRHEAGLHATISGKTFYELGDKVKKLMRPYLNWPHSLHQLTEIQDLLPQQILDVFQFGSHVRVAGGAPTEHIDLHFDTDERLDGRVVQFARHPCPLHGPRAGAKTPKKINRIERRCHLSQDVLRKAKFAFAAAADAAVYHDKTAIPLSSHLVANHEKRLGIRNGHHQMLKLRQVQTSSFIVESSNTAFVFRDVALHI